MNIRKSHHGKMVALIVLSGVALFTSGCGKKDADGDSAAAGFTSTDAANASMDEVIESSSEDSTDGTGAVFKVESPDVQLISVPAEIDRTCSVAGQEISIRETWKGSKSVTNERTQVSVANVAEYGGTQTRTWTIPVGRTAACTSAQGRAKLAWATPAFVNGLKMDMAVDRSRSRSRTITFKRRGTTVQSSLSSTVAGNRTVTWANSATLETGFIYLDKVISTNVSRSVSVTRDGSTLDAKYEVTNKSGKELRVQVKRAAATKALKQKIIQSGTLVMTRVPESTRVELAFENVTFDFTSVTPCTPTAGTITTSSFEKDATAASATQTITFGDDSVDSGVSVTIAGAKSDAPDFQLNGCEFEFEQN